MKLLTDTWRQLVQRRLWPVALLLLGALVAVPFVLSKPADTPAAPPAATTAGASASVSDPIVSMVSDTDRTEVRRVLGKRHDPFASSAPRTKTKATKSAKTTKSTNSDGSEDARTSSSGEGKTSSGGGTSASPTPTPDAPGKDTTAVPPGSIDVRFGSSSEDTLPRQTLARLQALPSADEPVLVYLGLKKDGKTARFLLGDGVTATGDGSCRPADTCETIELEVGETEFLDLAGDSDSTQFELDLVKIHKHATRVPSDQVVDGASTDGSTTGSG